MLASWDAASGGAWIQGSAIPNGILGYTEEGVTPESGQDYAVGQVECVYADGRPIGQFTDDANGTLDLGAEYDVVIAGLNYFSILETTDLSSSQTMGRQTQIKDVTADFYETMGAHVGSDRLHAADWHFSEDDFNTPMQPFSGYKGPAPFLRGTNRDPTVYVWIWDAVPMTIRSVEVNMEVTAE
jgi:hypothetical protein